MITWSSGVYTSQNATSASQTIWIEEQSGQNRVARTEWSEQSGMLITSVAHQSAPNY